MTLRTLSLAAFLLPLSSIGSAQTFQPQIPRPWTDSEVADYELPLAQPERSPRHVPEADYYRLPVRKIWRSYPVYRPDIEPPNYLEWLKNQEPEEVFNPAAFKTKQDWIRAGEEVFNAPNGTRPVAVLRNPALYRDLDLKVTPEGILPGFRYFIAQKGKVEVASDACAMCHTRLLDDGRIVRGGQPANRNELRQWIWKNRPKPAGADKVVQDMVRSLFWVPWLESDEMWKAATEESRIAHWDAAGIWTLSRKGTSETHPVHIPSLIGIQNHKYLDATGHVRHRGVADVMRYAITNESLMNFARYGDYQPQPLRPNTVRYSDEQLYALALFLYSLEPPQNPNKPTALSRAGERVFKSAGCAACHPAPLYSNNMLTPADGFSVPAAHQAKYAVMPVSVHTEPYLTMRTRRGTGYYKVPSLLGVWYRHGFGHGGWCATLEDWLDPARLRDDYVPTGYRPVGVKTMAVPGHNFGLDIKPSDKRSLIAFLKTL